MVVVTFISYVYATCHSLSSVNNVSSVLGGSSVMVPWCFLVLFSSPKEVMPFMKTKKWKWVFGHLSSDLFLFFLYIIYYLYSFEKLQRCLERASVTGNS